MRLFMKDAEEGRMAEIGAYLEQLMPGQFAALEARRREFVDEDVDKRASVPEVNWFMVAAAAPEDVRDTALDLAALHADASRNVRLIAKYRELVGYDYWRAVCDAGASEPGFQARAALWRAEYDARQARFDLARATYEEGFAAWREACRAIPALATDPRVAERIDEHMQGYRGVLTALEAPAAALDESDGRIDL